jgi:hypothetical protein
VKDWTTATDEELRVRVAELCGWKNIEWNSHMRFYNADGPKGWEQKGVELPRFDADLNAMHEAEKTLDVNIDHGDSPRYAYMRHLYNLVTADDGRNQPCRATARQRAIAFCMVMEGKGTE